MDLKNLSNIEVLQKFDINNLVSVWYEAKRSRVHGTERDSLSDQDWKMSEIRRLITEHGAPEKSTNEDNSTPQEQIWEMARTEREYDYTKGKCVVLHFTGKGGYFIR